MVKIFTIISFILSLFSCQISLKKSLEVDSYCSEMRWKSHPELGKKAALDILVIIGKESYWFQLDTGSDTTYLYSKNLKVDKNIKEWKSFRYFEDDVSIAGRKLGLRKIYLLDSMSKGDSTLSTAGTIGTDLLTNKIVMLNFYKNQLCLYNKDSFPKKIVNSSMLLSATMNKGKFILSLSSKLLGRKLPLSYDTGSSALPIFTDKGLWERITKNNKEEVIVNASTWGKITHFISRDSIEDFFIDGYRVNVEKVYYRKDKPNLFKSSGRDDFVGMIGNLPFIKHKWIYLDMTVDKPAFAVSKDLM